MVWRITKEIQRCRRLILIACGNKLCWCSSKWLLKIWVVILVIRKYLQTNSTSSNIACKTIFLFLLLKHHVLMTKSRRLRKGILIATWNYLSIDHLLRYTGDRLQLTLNKRQRVASSCALLALWFTLHACFRWAVPGFCVSLSDHLRQGMGQVNLNRICLVSTFLQRKDTFFFDRLDCWFWKLKFCIRDVCWLSVHGSIGLLTVFSVQ